MGVLEVVRCRSSINTRQFSWCVLCRKLSRVPLRAMSDRDNNKATPCGSKRCERAFANSSKTVVIPNDMAATSIAKSSRARFSIRAATRPSKSMCISKAARSGALRSRAAPAPANTKRGNCAMATRSAIGGKGVSKAVAAVNDVDRAGAARLRCARAGEDRRTDHRARRHAEQKETRRQRAPRCFARHRARGRGRRKTSRSSVISAAAKPGCCRSR